MRSLYEKILSTFNESSIDYPKEDLCTDIWDKLDNTYTLKPEVKQHIFDLLDACPVMPLVNISKEIHITGSIGTNQWEDSTDIDIHIIPENMAEWNEQNGKQVFDWAKSMQASTGRVGGHPIEVYIQTNEAQEMLSDAVYDAKTDQWKIGPKLAPLDYDPYEDFSDVFRDIANSVGAADLLIGELKRDVIDYDTVKKAIEDLPEEYQQKAIQRMQSKLKELEADVEALYKQRGLWVDARRNSSRPANAEQARADADLAAHWKDENARFKTISRYKYLRIIDGLKNLIKDDGKVTDNEVGKIKKAINWFE